MKARLWNRRQVESMADDVLELFIAQLVTESERHSALIVRAKGLALAELYGALDFEESNARELDA